jgi:hypothetical protein
MPSMVDGRSIAARVYSAAVLNLRRYVVDFVAALPPAAPSGVLSEAAVLAAVVLEERDSTAAARGVKW